MLKLTRLPQNPAFVCRGSLGLPVHARQWFEQPGRLDGNPEGYCYTDRLSYAPGETVVVHAISKITTLIMRVYSHTQPSSCLLEMNVTASWSSTAQDASVNGCNWPQICEFAIPRSWPSGAYRIYLFADSQIQAEHLIIVRPVAAKKGRRLLLITADCTWTAYNDWGGSNHYEGIVEPDSNRFSARLSTQRPFAKGLLSLPPGAPRTLPMDIACEGEITYPHMQWAWQHAYSKKYASAGWASYEQPFYDWAISSGYDCDIATQQDLHFRPEILAGYRCVAFVGHDEYWSWPMRDAIDHFVDAGGSVARFAGNFMWQIRLQNQGREQICHKYRAHLEDPLMHTDQQHLVSSSWEADFIRRPAHRTFGLNALKGMYAGWGGMAANGAGGFTLYRPDHWAFEGCKLGYGDILGAKSKIFGYEVDGLDYTIRNGLPFPEPVAGLPETLQILALGLARMDEDNFSGQPQPLFVGDDDAIYAAKVLYGDHWQANLAKVNRGSGMMIHFHKGSGEVFHAGTTEWVAGLLRKDQAVMQVTRNVMDRFLS